MTKSIIPAAAIIAVAPSVAQAAPVAPDELGADITAALTAFDAQTLKQNLYKVINTIGAQGTSEGYVQAVKDTYLVQTSALENEINTYNQGILDGNFNAEAAKAKHDEIQAQIDKIAQDAADMQKTYEAALKDAQDAVAAAQKKAEDVRTTIENFKFPSVKEKYTQQLDELLKGMPENPTSAEDKDANADIKATAEALKGKLTKLKGEAIAENTAFILELDKIQKEFENNVKPSLERALEDAANEIATLIENAGIDEAFKTTNAGYSDEIDTWWANVVAAKDGHTLDKEEESLKAEGKDIADKIAANLTSAKTAAETANNNEYVRITNLIEAQKTKYAEIVIKIKEGDTKSAEREATYQDLLSVAELGAEGFKEAGTSVKNEPTNNKNVEKLTESVTNLEKSVLGYDKYLNVKAKIEKVQEKYNQDILRLAAVLANKEVYQGVYEKANKALNEVATLIQQVTTENEALYVAEPVSDPTAYDELINKIKDQDAVEAVDHAIDLYDAQEAMSAKVAELAAVEITADSEVFATDIKTIKGEITALSDSINANYAAKYEAGEEEKNTFETELQNQINTINGEIATLNGDAAAELQAKNNALTILGTLKKNLAEADSIIKTDFPLIYSEYQQEISDLGKRIEDEEGLVNNAYTADAEAAAEPKNNAVRNIDIDEFNTQTDAAIRDLRNAAGGAYNDRVDGANEASLKQMNADVQAVQDKLNAAGTKLATYKDAEGFGPDFTEEIGVLQGLIDAQKTNINSYESAWIADKQAGIHKATLLSKLETVDKELFGESYPLTNEKNGGVWAKIDTLLTAAQLNKEAYDREIEKHRETSPYYQSFKNKIEALTYLTDVQEGEYKTKAEEWKQKLLNLQNEINTNYVDKKSVEFEAEVNELCLAATKDLTEEDYADNVTSALEAALNDNEYSRIVAAIEVAHTNYINAIDSARVDWATQYGQISGIYADATGIEDYKEDLGKALAGYQNELSTDIAKLNELKGMVGTAYEEALAEAKEYRDAINSRNCKADEEYNDVYTEEIKDVNEHINSTEARATENLNAFKQQIAYVGVKDAEGDYTEGSLLYNYNRGVKELAKAEQAVLDGTTDQKPVLDEEGNQLYNEDGTPKFETLQYTSEELAKAKEELDKIKAKIDTLEANICAQHIALDAANYGTTAADKYAELTAAMTDLRNSSVTSYNAEVAEFNQAVLDFTTKYGDEVKKVYDEYISTVEAYKSYTHADYSQFVSDVQDIFFGLADSLRAIVADAKTACAASTAENKYFDVKELTHWNQLDEVKTALDNAYAKFLQDTEPLAETYGTGLFNTKEYEINTASNDVTSYGYDKALAKLDDVKAAFGSLKTDFEQAKTDNVLPQKLNGYEEALNAINVSGAWNEAAKVYCDSIIGKAKALVEEFKGTQYVVGTDTTAYGEWAQGEIDDAVSFAEDRIVQQKATESRAYAEGHLYNSDCFNNIRNLIDGTGGIKDALAIAKSEADRRQSIYYNDITNKTTYATVLIDYNALVQKYEDAVTTIAGYDDEVQALVDSKLNAEGGNIGTLKTAIDKSYANFNWPDDNYATTIAQYEDDIDGILTKAAQAQDNIDDNTDYAKVAKLYAAASALVEPYNRAEVYKGTTEAAIAEASAIYKLLSEYLKNFSDATKAFDAATTDEAKDAAGIALKAYADAEEYWQGEIDKLAKRIKALDIELTAYNELKGQMEQLDAEKTALWAEIGEYANGDEVLRVLNVKPYDDAYNAANVAIEQSHALNRADQDAEKLQGKIDAAKAALEAVREEAMAIDQALTDKALKDANDAAYKILNAKVNNAYGQLNAVWKKINKELTYVQAADYTQQYDAVMDALNVVKNQLDDDYAAIALTAESTVDLTAATAAIEALNDAAVAAQTAADNAAQAAMNDLNVDYNKALAEIQNILVPDIVEEYESALAEIQNNIVDPLIATVDAKNADLQKIEEAKGAIGQVVADAKAAVEKFESKGNLNGGQLNATDYGILVDYVTGYLTPDAEQLYLADVNSDGELDVADLTNLVNLILGKTDIYEINGYGTAKAKAINDTNSDITASASVSNNRLGIALTSNVDIVAMQADVTIPEGTTVNQILGTMRSKGLNVYSNNLEDNVVRVVLASADNNVISGNEGDVLTMALTGSTSGITIDNIKVADANGNSYKLEALAAGEATGIKGITADELKGARIFDAAGVETGKLGKGANIIVKANGEKITVVK